MLHSQYSLLRGKANTTILRKQISVFLPIFLKERESKRNIQERNKVKGKASWWGRNGEQKYRREAFVKYGVLLWSRPLYHYNISWCTIPASSCIIVGPSCIVLCCCDPSHSGDIFEITVACWMSLLPSSRQYNPSNSSQPSMHWGRSGQRCKGVGEGREKFQA